MGDIGSAAELGVPGGVFMPGMACMAPPSDGGGVKTGIGIVVMSSGDAWAGTAGGGAVPVSGPAWDGLLCVGATGAGAGRVGVGAGRVWRGRTGRTGAGVGTGAGIVMPGIGAGVCAAALPETASAAKAPIATEVCRKTGWISGLMPRPLRETCPPPCDREYGSETPIDLARRH